MSDFIKEGQYHNLVYNDEMQKQVSQHKDYEGIIKLGNNGMREVLKELLNLNPTWRVVMNRGYPMGAYMRVSGVEVKIDGESVGVITDTYVRGTYGVQIDCHKLQKPVRTGNVKKAISICNKSFSKRNTAERVAAAQQDAETLLSTVASRMAYDFNRTTHDLRTLAFDYVINRAREDFAKQLLANDQQVLRKYDEQAAHMTTIESVSRAFADKKSWLVVKDGDRYIAKSGDNVALYDPSELSEDIRSKIGMLKLCEDGQMVHNIGCRINEEVFVVLVNEEGANNA